MDPKEQLLEVQHVLDRLTRFRHLNGWAAVAAGVLSIVAYAVINITFQVPWIKETTTPETALGRNEVIQYGLYLLGLLVVATAVCGAIILVSLPKDLTRMAFKNLLRLIAVYAGYILSGAVLLAALLFQSESVTFGLLKIIPAMMCIFYGLAQLHAAHFSLPALKYLGLWILACGALGCLLPPFSWLLWVTGFGLGHIVTGLYVVSQNKN